jgi:hypothetical protein
MLDKFSATWLRALRRYVFAGAAFNLAWEFAQLPFYTAWSTAGIGELIFDVLHCTVGDTMIASLSLFTAIVVAGSVEWPKAPFTAVTILTVFFGLGYTIYSEWHNTVVTHAWSYAASMPTFLGIGLAPVAQWLVVPICTFWLLHRQLPRHK